MSKKYKPILCLDFDGVIHEYSSGWKGADTIPDAPVDGAMQFLWDATEQFRVCIFSSRSNQPGGRAAMQTWLRQHFMKFWGTHAVQADDKLADIEWPTEKPPAMVTIDDRALTFTGKFPTIEQLMAFQPWNKGGATVALVEAAPDLLAACKAHLAAINGPDYADAIDEVERASELIAAAVEKAEGRR